MSSKGYSPSHSIPLQSPQMDNHKIHLPHSIPADFLHLLLKGYSVHSLKFPKYSPVLPGNSLSDIPSPVYQKTMGILLPLQHHINTPCLLHHSRQDTNPDSLLPSSLHHKSVQDKIPHLHNGSPLRYRFWHNNPLHTVQNNSCSLHRCTKRIAPFVLLHMLLLFPAQMLSALFCLFLTLFSLFLCCCKKQPLTAG